MYQTECNIKINTKREYYKISGLNFLFLVDFNK